jgi:hypothetical protein
MYFHSFIPYKNQAMCLGILCTETRAPKRNDFHVKFTSLSDGSDLIKETSGFEFCMQMGIW